jgi:hypothetical protein
MNARACLITALGVSALGAASCGRGADTGNIVLDVSVPSDANFEIVRFEIGAPHRETIGGHIETSRPAASFSKFVSHLPAGTGYEIQADATSVDGLVVCTGVAPVDVRAGQTTEIDMTLTCTNIDDGQVHIVIGVSCPWFQVTYTVSPLTASVGGEISVSATTTAPDAGAVSYTWTSSSGTFADATLSETTYTCTNAGASLLMVQATTGPCHATKALTIDCVSDGGVD